MDCRRARVASVNVSQLVDSDRAGQQMIRDLLQTRLLFQAADRMRAEFAEGRRP